MLIKHVQYENKYYTILYNNIVDIEKWTQSPFNEPEMDSFHFLGSTKLADSTHSLSAQ